VSRSANLISDRAFQCAIESAKYGADFVELAVPADAGTSRAVLLRAWRNRTFLVQLYQDGSFERLSINRASIDAATDRWKDGISWDELMECKRAVGYGDRWCVEAYPPDAAVVNVANIRHLFVLDDPPIWAWNRGAR
jgi:hypothetical protein